jgi:dTDP-4-dehydrorhamnose 3,5-epimerase-like enzyme
MTPDPLAKLIEFPVAADIRGNLCFVEARRHVPFPIERVYFLYDVPSGAVRAGHAHRELNQVLIAISGSFDVSLNDGRQQELIKLNRSSVGLMIGPGVWREINNFSSNAVCLVLASSYFDEAEYIRDFDDFLRHVEV